jgi:hypothetical protein
MKGFGYVMGATIGYQTKINDKFMMSFLGGEPTRIYKGYLLSTGERYETAKIPVKAD